MDGFAFLIAFVSFIMALLALNKISKLQTAIFKLREELQRIGPASAPAAAVEATPAEAPAVEQAPAEPAPVEALAAAEAPVEEVPPSAPAPARDMEQALAGRWFVWIGGVAIAIGGLLFVKYAYDNGLISPQMQIMLGIAAGLVLILLGAIVRGRAPAVDGAAPDYVPAALSAAGIAVLFAAVYAAYALYGIIAPTTAFFGLAAVGLGSLALSRWQGPFIAALGLIGSYVTPMLIPSAEPSAANFFPYLMVILTASLLTLRGRSWWWLGHAAVIATFLWSVAWLAGPFVTGDTLTVGLSAIAIGLLALFVPRGPGVLWLGRESRSDPLTLGLVGLAAMTVILVLLVLRTDHVDTALRLLAAGMALLVVIAWLSRSLARLAPFAALVMLGVLGSWREAAFHAMTLDEYGLWSWSNSFGPETGRFLRWMLGAGGAFAIVGAAGVLMRRRKAAWGALGGGAGFLFLFVAWARADFLLTEQYWATLAVLTALFLLLVTWLWSFRRAGDDRGAGLLATGGAALLVMALFRLYDGVWLTLAIAALAFALAVLSLILKPRLMGWVTAAVATLATIRLFLSRELWLDDKSLPLGEHWILYGYGVPAVLFFLGSKVLRRAEHPRAAMALEGMCIGLLISLASLEIRVLIGGGITYEDPRFLEMAAHILTWAGAAYGLMHRQQMFSSFVSLWASRLLLLASAAGAVLLSLGALNPVVTGEPVAGSLWFNALLLAYLAPVPLIGLIATRLGAIGWERLKPVAGGLALALLFAYVTLQTKRYFQGMMMVPESLSLAETYAYSAVWLAFALVLFIVGIRLGRQPVRLAGLGVLALVVVKVFLGDMSNLEGLFRIASFVGLGLCLVGIGWLYQHFVRRPGDQRPQEA
jgi:uncharacterized membrane protein